MDLQEIQKLNKKSLGRLTSDEYRAAFEDPQTADAFKQKVEELSAATQFVDGDPEAQAPVTSVPAAVPAQTAPASEEVKWYSYQPLSRDGKKIGGLQRFSYTNDASLIAQLQKAHSNACAELFRIRQDRALDDIGSLPDGPSKDVPLTVAQPRSLTVEETVQVTRLRAEGKTLEAERIKLAATLGIDPTELVSRINRTQEDSLRTAINTTIREWKRQTPDFYPCESNNKALIALIGKKGWSPTDPKSWSEAYNYLHEKDALVTKDSPEAVAMQAIAAPEVQPVVQPAVPPAVQPAVQPAAVSQPAVPISTGLTRRNSSDSRPVEATRATSDNFTYTLAEINAMPSAQYGKLVNNPRFAKYVDELEARAAESRRSARS